MYMLQVPPFVEVAVATTDEEIGLLRHHHAFVKPPLRGTSISEIGDLLEKWSLQVLLAEMRDPEIHRLDDDGRLSKGVILQAAKNIIDNVDGATRPDDVFYLIYTSNVLPRVENIRDTLVFANGPEIIIGQEINGVAYWQWKPATFWLSNPGCSAQGLVKLAFYRSSLFQDLDGPNGWRLLKHSSTQPILTWYVPPNEPALRVESTFAVADTFEIEERAINILRDAVERAGTPMYDVDSHPNGRTDFPDYKAVIGGQPWAIEITRPLGTIASGRVITMGTARTPRQIDDAVSSPGLGSSAIRDGLSVAIQKKSNHRKDLALGEKYCLLLVDTMGTIAPGDPEQWEDCELSAFDSVVLVRLIPERPDQVTLVKGGIPLSSALSATSW